jgi:hypothetical protein
MHLLLLFPKVEPEKLAAPTHCAYPSCTSKKFRLRQVVRKALRDTVYKEVVVHRFQCLVCGHTFRVYPEGISAARTSQRVKCIAGLLYLLGLSYGAISLRLEGLGVHLVRSQVYTIVQEVVGQMSDLRLYCLLEDMKLSSVKYQGGWQFLGSTANPVSGSVSVAMNPTAGPVLSIQVHFSRDSPKTEAERMQILKDWIEPIAKNLGVQILVIDNIDRFKAIADEIGI